MRWLKRLLLFAGAAAILGAIVWAMMPQPIGVDVVELKRGPLQVAVREDGVTRIKEKYAVSTPLAGRLMRIDLKVGDPVTAGETVLARMQPTDPSLLDPREIARATARVKASEGRLSQASAELAQAQAALEFAETELGRVQKLAQGRAATDEQLDEAKLTFRRETEAFRVARFAEEIARFELEQERAALLRTQPDASDDDHADERDPTRDFLIRSPITGRVLRVFQESAAVLATGASLLELGDPRDLEIVVDVLSTDAVRVQPGQRVRIEQWGGEKPLNGLVRLVEPSGFTKISALGVEEQRVNVLADFTDPLEARETLGDGFRIEAEIVTWESDDVLVIPTSALFRQGESWAVFVVESGRAVTREIEIDHSNGLQAEVASGLKAGERVIVHPSDEVTDGVEVFERGE